MHSALAFLHRKGVAYLNLSTGVLWVHGVDCSLALVGGFHYSRVMDYCHWGGRGVYDSTAAFLPPRHLDERGMDIFDFGTVLLELVSGNQAMGSYEVGRGEEGVQDVIKKCWEGEIDVVSDVARRCWRRKCGGSGKRGNGLCMGMRLLGLTGHRSPTHVRLNVSFQREIPCPDLMYRSGGRSPEGRSSLAWIHTRGTIRTAAGVVQSPVSAPTKDHTASKFSLLLLPYHAQNCNPPGPIR